MNEQSTVAFVPKDIRGLATLVLLFGSGSFEEIRALGFEVDVDVPEKLAAFCPQLGIAFDPDKFWIEESVPEVLDANFVDALLSTNRLGERPDMSDQERCFERLSAIAAHLIEVNMPERSIELLKLAGQILKVGNKFNMVSQSGEAGFVKQLYGDIQNENRLASVPHLRVKLFGNLEIELDGLPLTSSRLYRGLARNMFCLLTLNQGKGISRETMLDWLWPERSEPSALPSFYNLWSKLTKALPSNNGTSYYFSSEAQILRVNPRHVSSDVADFERLSRAVLFEQGSVDERLSAVDRLEQLYANDILAGCSSHPQIVLAQARYHSKYTDVLLSASALHLSQQNNSMALWYAGRALDVDPKREDVYRALMNTQEACGQRTQAINTFHECRKYLDEELGLLPSRQTIALFESLILDGQ